MLPRTVANRYPFLEEHSGSFRILKTYPSACAQQFRDIAGAGNDFDALTDQLSEQLLSCRIHEGEGGEIKAGLAGQVRAACARVTHFVNPGLQELALEPNGLGRVRTLNPSEPKHGELSPDCYVVVGMWISDPRAGAPRRLRVRAQLLTLP